MNPGRRHACGLLAAAALLVLLAGCVDHAGREQRRKQGFIRAHLDRHAPRLSETQRRDVARAMVRAEQRYGLDALLLLAVAHTESEFDPRARSRGGARGLMQLMPATAREVAPRAGLDWHGVDRLDDPGYSVALGAHYLAQLTERFETVEQALAAYNRGPSRVRRALARSGRPPRRYASRVLQRHQKLLDRHGGVAGER